MPNFQAHTVEEHQQALGQYFLNDRLGTNKNIIGSNLYKMFMGLAGEFQRVDALFQSVWDETNILTTQDINYIELWEGAVGIPNSYFTQTTSLSLDSRRQQVLIQLRSLGVLTEQDFIDLAALLGYIITIQQGIEALYPPYSVPFIPMGNENQARFVMIVYGLGGSLTNYPPYDVPFIPINPGSQLQILFNILKPSNTIILYS
jgi:uncharacterized protein YmfQ (DUF2313 family)